MRFLLAVAASLSLTHPAFGADCTALAKDAETQAVAFHPVETHRVTGSGRLYFFSAPNLLCKTPKVFVIPGDSLIVYAEHDGWYQVMFVNTKTQTDHSGWVQKPRLTYQGTLAPKN